MKPLKAFSIILAASLTFCFVFTSCKKKDENTESKTQSFRSAQDNSTAQSLFSGVFSQIQSTHAKVTQSKSTDTVITGVPIITITPGGFAFPKTVTLDYGTTYSLCSDYAYRKGKIISTISAPYHDSLCYIHSVIQPDFYVKVANVEYKVNGVHKMTNMGHNQAGHPFYDVVVDSASVVAPEGTIKWGSELQYEFFAGYDTWFNPFDDVYYITGHSDGTDLNGAAFTVSITSALVISVSCHWISQGTLDVLNPGYPTITIDYGTGTCDGIITVTYDGYTTSIVFS